MDVTETIKHMQDYYGKRAPIYDQSMGYDDPARTAAHAGLIEFLRLWLRDRRVLEIACGPGYWTREVAQVAASLLATDANESVLREADKKHYPDGKVTFCLADAYTLRGVESGFDAAFAVDWWAHVPKSKRANFLRVLHSKLVPGGCVLLVDQLPRPNSITGIYDTEGNHYQTRMLPGGDSFQVIKNFTGENEFIAELSPLGCTAIEYHAFPEIRRSVLKYALPQSPANNDIEVKG